MIDLVKKILSTIIAQAGPEGERITKLERALVRQFESLKDETRTDNRNRWLALGIVLLIVTAGAYIGIRSLQKETRTSVADRLDKEFSSARLQQSIDDAAKKFAEQHLKDYVDGKIASQVKVARLESMARFDSRQAYAQLLELAQDPAFKGDAEFSLSVVRKRFEPLVYPFEAPSAAAETHEVSAIQLKMDPLKSAEPQIDALRPRLSQLAQESEKNYLVPDFIRFLKESDSLGASVGICRILIHNYGTQAGDYEFDKWIAYLETLDKNAVKISGKQA